MVVRTRRKLNLIRKLRHFNIYCALILFAVVEKLQQIFYAFFKRICVLYALINIDVTFLTPNWSKKVKTKNGNCDKCALCNSERCKEFILATDKSNVSNPDIFVVTDLKKHGSELVNFLRSKFPNKKYLIITNVMCDNNGNLNEDVYKNCFSNFVALSKTINANNLFVYCVNCYDKSFKIINNLNDFEKALNDIYKPIQKSICKYHTFKIPDKYYTSNYRLVDIQYINYEDRLIYIFRDKNNEPEIYEYPISNDNFYWYKAVSSNRIVEKIENVKFCTGKYKNRIQDKTGYGGDMNICTQHCVDYYLNNQEEAPVIRHNIMYFDIETFQYNEDIFPDPDEAKYPIVAISFRTDRPNDYTHVYLVALDGYIDKTVYEKVKQYKHITIFKDEISMLKAWFMKIREEKINILTGWNCIDENSLIFCKDKILKIKDLNSNEKLLDSDVVRKSNGEYKESYVIKLSNGSEIVCSKDHIFPIVTKNKDDYSNLKCYGKCKCDKYDKNVTEIIDLMKNKDIYFTLKRHYNTNPDLTYLDYIKENIDFISSNYKIDINNNIRKYTRDEILNYLNNNNHIKIYMSSRTYVDINVYEIIDVNYLHCLGLIYTDGSYDFKYNSISFYNKNRSIMENYVNVVKPLKHRYNNYDSTLNKKFAGVFVNKITKSNILGFLFNFIYDNNKKDINVTLLSKLSHKQFMAFFSGCIDGDGSVTDSKYGSICFCNYNNDIKDIQTLLFWNGYLCGIDKDNSNLTIYSIEFDKIKKDLCLWSDYKNNHLYKLRNSIKKITSSDKIKYRDFGDYILMKVNSITKSHTKFMYDIETTSHYFYANAIKTHNCFGFDYPFIINRVKKLKIKEKDLYYYGSFYGNSDRGSTIPGLVLLDQIKLFKEFHHGILPSYSLNNVSILTLGHGKVEHEDKSIDRMYCSDIDLYLKYSTTDTDLIYELEQALGHISLQCEIRRVATCSHQQANSSLGEANGLYATQMKSQGLIARNYTHDIPKLEAFRGAYVFDARPGIYQGLLCDFDFKSLYPSIICTWNIGPDTYIGKISEDDANLYVFNKNALKNKKITLVVDPLYQNKTMKVTLDQLEKFMNKYHAQITIIGTIFCGHDIKESINYKVLNMLMDSRSLYKAKMLNAKEAGDKATAREYNDKQLAFKILANMLYGALGQEHFRFFNPILGESITVTGQEMIKYSAVHTDYYMEGKFNNKGFYIDPQFFDKVKYTKNVVYGDTDSIFVYLTDYLNRLHLPVEKCPDVLNAVSDVQKYINKTILPTLLQKHNVKLDKSQMYLKNEFLMDRYYALNAKKKYASHIISQEGKTIDEIDIKGLEIKRSEIPPRSQKMLSEILDVILDTTNTKTDIKRKVTEIREKTKKEMMELTKNGDISIAKTVAYSKKPEDYKVLPQHLLGMYTWNCLIGQEEFKYGSKGKLFNVLGIDLNKAPKNIQDNYYKIYCEKFPNTPIEAIVIPENVKKLPDYFIPDMKTTIRYSCDDRVDTMMSGLYIENDSELLF